MLKKLLYLKNFKRGKAFMSSVDPKEMNFFDKVNDWWDPNGSMKVLHSYNKLRVEFIKKSLGFNNKKLSCLEGKKILDVGCGGGVLSESLGRLGGNIIGIDPNENSIRIAESHLKKDPELIKNVEYKQTSIENFEKNNKFDIVCSMEVIEHVNNPKLFVHSLLSFVNEEGYLFLSTINKTLLSYLSMIVSAEYILRIVPVGTHDWEKFITPEEIKNWLNDHTIIETVGLGYNPLNNLMFFTENLNVNFMIACKIKKEINYKPNSL